MRIAVLSDIHSNCFALEAVLGEAAAEGVEQFLILGDLFGYYPWAVETYRRLRALPAVLLQGNHDQLVGQVAGREDPHWTARLAHANRLSLAEHCPEALVWLASLPTRQTVALGSWKALLVHGTPADPSLGRYYPDDTAGYAWLPDTGHMLLMGHTHYPILRYSAAGGIVLNPGSVGQPRDGNPSSAWALVDLEEGVICPRRTAYDWEKAVGVLEAMGWEGQATRALGKVSSPFARPQPPELHFQPAPETRS